MLKIAWIDAIFVVKDIIMIFRKIKTILILISFKRYFSHPEKSLLNFKSSFTQWRHCNSGHWTLNIINNYFFSTNPHTLVDYEY